MDDTTIRLDKYLSSLGICSRRAVDDLLKDKTVTINGKRVSKSGVRIALHDKILINGERLKKPQLKYYLLNKPKGYISTTSDQQSRKNVTSLIKTDERIYPVGRLDKDTTGLLLLTNDGRLTYILTHPKHHVAKTYRLTIMGSVSDEQIGQLQNGILLEDGPTSPAEVTVIRNNTKLSLLDMTIHEGRNRQIRRMCAHVGLALKELERTAIGSLRDPALRPGEYRELTKNEIKILKNQE